MLVLTTDRSPNNVMKITLMLGVQNTFAVCQKWVHEHPCIPSSDVVGADCWLTQSHFSANLLLSTDTLYHNR